MARARVSVRRSSAYPTRSARVRVPRDKRVRHGGHAHRTVNAPKSPNFGRS